ncbi:YebC/PmpR family DNA-binding transcriptional regulator [Candidatus Beckwithbacteria bacterium CG23_combo_of_CG06-09_8_20_14_all_34_8]|uniref:Probable transcriptional regulatory protein COX08_00600 n=1 Tax=Candidatus Beckwithbacteria bacterium CG23_combo_of_CG06-09_8_20_14_all_34_8 TaxID=1974497 RepID=A0A2H0B721_9BACT|nr:MAG: YebC/PmpR family DNA-binding transcriptional regulator [Candidatus Beckwithbacteria bacterium CG23_combo_of_CG06-09_8_20_14_all_34_8]
MSGHSKWATIKHGKAILDAKRGKIFSRYSKEISIAVREGGSDNPDFNPRLRLAIERARAENMPKENIKRAVDKGAGRVEGQMYEEIVYEGFGPNQVAMMILCVTDNKNRTNSEIRSLLDKNGGTLGSAGTVSYNFDRKGIITVSLPDNIESDDLQLQLIDLGAEDIKDLGDNIWQIIVDPANTHSCAEAMSQLKLVVEESKIGMVPKSMIDLDKKAFERFENFYDVVDDHDDVQEIYHNAQQI